MADLRVEGYSYFPTVYGDLIELVVLDKNRRASYLHPTEDDIRQMCGEFGLPYEKTWSIIKHRPPDAHTVFINVPVYLAEENK